MKFNIFSQALTSSFDIGTFNDNVDTPYGIFKEGIFKKTTTTVGTFTHMVLDTSDVLLPIEQSASFDFTPNPEIPRIPGAVLESILNFFIEVYKEIKSEVFVLVYWDTVKRDFIIHVPKQQVSGATVKYENDPLYLNDGRYVAYLDIHSHNTMKAFFSATDLKDEIGSRYFGVLGEITTEPKLALRVGFNGQSKDLNIKDLFDYDVEKLNEDSDYSLDYSSLKHLITERSAYKAPTTSYTYPNIYKDNPSKKYDTTSTLLELETYTSEEEYLDTAVALDSIKHAFNNLFGSGIPSRKAVEDFYLEIDSIVDSYSGMDVDSLDTIRDQIRLGFKYYDY